MFRLAADVASVTCLRFVAVSPTAPALLLAPRHDDKPLVLSDVKTTAADVDANTTVASVCVKQDLLSPVIEAASPYLYPCCIAYCLIAAGAFPSDVTKHL